MSLGTKLQTVSQKVNTKMGLQDADVTFRIASKAARANIGETRTVTNDDLVISSGLKIRTISDFQIKAPGQMEAGDLSIEIPGNLITEARLKDEACEILYKSERWSIYRVTPAKFVSGVAVKWRVLAKRIK